MSKKPKKNKELIGEYRALTAYYKTNGKELFCKQFENIPSPEEVINKRIDILREWSQEDSFFLTDYPYIHQKPKRSEKKQFIRIYLLLLG